MPQLTVQLEMLLFEFAKRFCSDWLAFSAFCSKVLLCLLFFFLQLAELLCCREPWFCNNCQAVSVETRLQNGSVFNAILSGNLLLWSVFSGPHSIAFCFALLLCLNECSGFAQVFSFVGFSSRVTKVNGCQEQLREDAFPPLIPLLGVRLWSRSQGFLVLRRLYFQMYLFQSSYVLQVLNLSLYVLFYALKRN